MVHSVIMLDVTFIKRVVGMDGVWTVKLEVGLNLYLDVSRQLLVITLVFHIEARDRGFILQQR